MKKFKKRLQCVLNDGDVAALAHRLVDHLQQIDTIKMRAGEAAKNFKEKIAGQTSQAKELEGQIESQTREQDVECVEIVPPGSGDAITLRMDTGDEVSRRRVTDEDKQGNLLTLVAPANDQEAAEQEDEKRILSLFDLAERLKGADMELGRNLKRLWTLNADQITEARKWAMQKKSVGLNGVAPEPPEWLVSLQAESMSDVAAEKELDIRVNTIKAVLVEQSVIVQDADIRAWSKAEQDTVMAWTDSLLSETPLPRPELLEKYVTKDPEPWMPPAEGQQEEQTSQSSSASSNSETLSDTSAPGGDGTTEPVVATDPFKDLDAPVSAESSGTAKTNGHMPREDMAAKIQELGVDVDASRVSEWSLDEADLAYEWIRSTQEAIDSNGERKPAPAFFFE